MMAMMMGLAGRVLAMVIAGGVRGCAWHAHFQRATHRAVKLPALLVCDVCDFLDVTALAED